MAPESSLIAHISIVEGWGGRPCDHNVYPGQVEASQERGCLQILTTERVVVGRAAQHDDCGAQMHKQRPAWNVVILIGELFLGEESLETLDTWVHRSVLQPFIDSSTDHF